MHRQKLTLVLIVIMITAVVLSLFSACSNERSNPTEIDVGEITFYRTEMEHVATNPEGFMYVDNEILIVANADASYSDIENIAKGIGAEIVGWIEQTGDYQLKLNQTYTADQLNELIDSLNKNQFVDSAYINFASQIDSSKTEERNGFYFGNEWNNDLQNFNNCKGDSWGIEAIEVLAAWDILDMYKRNVNPVKVGLIDSAFDTNHEDLGFAETFYNVDSGKDHGTHVAGTMAAKTDNREGICGVYPYGNGNLYGVSYSGICSFSENGDPFTTSMFLKIAYAELILRDVKVINSSLGFNYYKWPLSYNDPEWDEQVSFLESNAYVLGDFLDRLLNKGYDFVLVNAAGNDSNRSNGVVYDSKYNFWTTIISEEDYPAVYNRIIVVGSVNSNYDISNFSNGGDRVDIYAPGEKIFSTVPDSEYENTYKGDDGKKYTWDGTSMAAPHVSGVAAMVWSVNNELTGAQVKEIVCSSHSFRCPSCNMVDAYVAMRKATHTDDTTDSTEPENGAILCWVVSADDNEDKIQNATVTLLNTQSGEEFSTTTDSMGHFEIFVPAGTYTLVVKADGYEDFAWPNEDEPYTNPISVDNENVNYLADWIKMKPARSSSQKKLSSVVVFQNGDMSEEYHFTYNDLGQVISLVAYRYEDGNAIKWYTQNYEYDGNGNPILTKHIGSRGSVQTYQYQYDYDSAGRITGYSSIEYYEDIPGPSDTYIFSYDDQGRVVERRNEYGSSVEEFSYDESGKTVYESSELYWGDGHFIETTVYDYTYAPLVISTHTSESKEYGNSSSKSISFMPHWNLTVASGTIDDSCSFDVDSSGYLLRIIDANGNTEFICNYQKVMNDDIIPDSSPESSVDQFVAATYIPAIERVASNELCSNVCGFLFDLDGDNTDELVLYYGLREETYAIPIHTFDVYDVEDGQLITRLEKVDIGSADVGGSSGNIGIEYHDGTPVLATYTRNGWSSPGYYVFDASYEIKLYDCHTYSSARSISVDVNEHDSGYTITHIIDGKELSEDSFRQEIEQYKRIFLDDYDSYSYVSWNYSATGDSFEQKQTVYDLLRYLQQTAKISPESSPILTQKDAEDIAYSIWSEYLERTQGFDWKIFEEGSIIKNGVEYYCYTLNTNSRYGAEDWSIHNYLFVNSVTGEYDHSLF